MEITEKKEKKGKAQFPFYQKIRKNEEVKELIRRGNEVLGALGYTEHSEKHAVKTAETAGKILKELGYPKRTAELA